MSRALSRRPFRIGLFVFVLCVVAAAILLLPPRSAKAISCGVPSYPSESITYYSGPNHKKVVGECLACGGGCSGITTGYAVAQLQCCPGSS